MKIIWKGDITLDEAQTLPDITLSSVCDVQDVPLLEGPLRFLSVVDPTRIPLHMICGSPLFVQSNNAQTLGWLSSILLSDEDAAGAIPWWQSARTDSPLAILVATGDVDPVGINVSGPRVTELLVFASTDRGLGGERLPTAPSSTPLDPITNHETQLHVNVFGLPLSSRLLARSIAELTPPQSPTTDGAEQEATFLPSAWDQQIHEPPVRKRRSAAELFDDSEERRRKQRRKGGQGVSAAAAAQSRPEDVMPGLNHRRSTSNAKIPMVNRPLSRSSSVSSNRPVRKLEPSVPALARPSLLSQSQSAPAISQVTEENTLQRKNKDFLPKIIMGAMRMKGLEPGKSRRSRANSAVALPAIEVTFDQAEEDGKKDEEWKQVYHQVYKGIRFMFRHSFASMDLQLHISAVDEAVNQLLGILLQDPLAVREKPIEEEFTPGGRKLFGSSAVQNADSDKPFLQAAMVERDSKANTPCSRGG